MSTPGKIAQTVFKTGPDDKLITTDVYSESPSTAQLTQISDNSASITNEIAKAGQWLGSSDGVLSVIKSLTVGSGGKVKLDAKALSKRLIEASGGNNSPFNDIVVSTKNRLLGALGLPENTISNDLSKNAVNLSGQDLRKQLTNQILFKNATTLIDAATNIESTKDVVKLLNSVVTDGEIATFFDSASKFAILGDVLTQASRLGIPDVIDSVLDNLADDKQKQKLLVDNLYMFVQQGDLDNIQKVLDECGRSKLLARMPNIVNQILKMYRFGNKVTVADYPSLTTKLVNLLNGLNPNWTQYNRAGDVIGNLEPFTEASPDSLTLLKNTNTYRLAAMIGPTYRSINVMDELKRQYPLAALS